ncbi:F-box/LRR-repeat protein 16-like [Littorina saxatilis]|uniref:F-box domain-containing protein n=1 Tax=Littorina saxatilis TaxID=31220 RepID=A0AAN9GN67_9CAEN
MASRLPIEVVTHVMSFLGVSDRKEAALVCRAWYEASLDPLLQRNILVNFAYDKTEEILQSFCRRHLTHLVLSHFDNSSVTKKAILRTCELGSEYLQSLSLKDSNITEGTLVELLSRCPQLTSLDLSGCNSLFMAGTLLNNQTQVKELEKAMKNVTEVNLSSLRYLSDCSFNRVVAIFPKLQKIVLASTQITFNGHAYYARNTTVYDNSAVFTYSCLERYIENNVARIKGLNFSRTTINNQHLARLSGITDLRLEELVLIGCRDVGNEGIGQLCRQQTRLKRLDISGCLDLTDSALGNITQHLTSLEALRVNKCRMLTDSSVATLKNLDRIKSLDLSECYEVTKTGLLSGLCMGSKAMDHLTHLNLSCCSKLDTEVVVKLTVALPFLEHLDLGSCFLLQDVGLHMISSTLHRLRFLRLAWCKALTDLGLLGFKAEGFCPIHDPVTSVMEGECSCTHKSHTPIIFRKPTDALREKKEAALRKMLTELETTIIPENLSALTSLRSLDLSSCPQFTDLGLRGAVKFCELRVLKLNCVHGLTGSGLTEIASNNPGLEELQLQQCSRITDASVDAVTSRCQRLSHLDLSNCDRLTDTALIHIGDNCKRLRHLDISFCCGLSPQAADMLEGRLRSLITLLRRNLGMSTLGLQAVSI